MKYLVFGDVHGNLPALEMLLKKEASSYDMMICHGDVVNYGPWSNQCVQLLSRIDNCICLQGNHEKAFIEGSYHGTHPVARAFFDFCYPGFTETPAISKYTLSCTIGPFKVTHTIRGQYIFMDTPLNIDSLHENCIIGHSHQQFRRTVGEFELVNTGSLGQNRTHINVAEYIIYDSTTNEVELKRFTFDIDYVIKEMEARGYSKLCLDYYRSKKRA